MDERWWHEMAVQGAMWWCPWGIAPILKARTRDVDAASPSPDRPGPHGMRVWWDRAHRPGRSAPIVEISAVALDDAAA